MSARLDYFVNDSIKDENERKQFLADLFDCLNFSKNEKVLKSISESVLPNVYCANNIVSNFHNKKDLIELFYGMKKIKDLKGDLKLIFEKFPEDFLSLNKKMIDFGASYYVKEEEVNYFRKIIWNEFLFQNKKITNLTEVFSKFCLNKDKVGNSFFSLVLNDMNRSLISQVNVFYSISKTKLSKVLKKYAVDEKKFIKFLVDDFNCDKFLNLEDPNQLIKSNFSFACKVFKEYLMITKDEKLLNNLISSERIKDFNVKCFYDVSLLSLIKENFDLIEEKSFLDFCLLVKTKQIQIPVVSYVQIFNVLNDCLEMNNDRWLDDTKQQFKEIFADCKINKSNEVLFQEETSPSFVGVFEPSFLIKNLNLEKKINPSELKYFMNWFLKLNKIEDLNIKSISCTDNLDTKKTITFVFNDGESKKFLISNLNTLIKEYFSDTAKKKLHIPASINDTEEYVKSLTKLVKIYKERNDIKEVLPIKQARESKVKI